MFRTLLFYANVFMQYFLVEIKSFLLFSLFINKKYSVINIV